MSDAIFVHACRTADVRVYQMATRVCLILLFSALAWADPCDPPARVAQFLRTLPENHGERQKMIGEALKSNPDDFWLNRLFLDGSVYQRSAIREKYRLKFEANRTLENRYLYGRSLVGFNTKEALRIYSRILEDDRDNPWVYNSQLEIYRSEAFRDREKLRASFEAVTRVSPSWTEPYRYLTALDDAAMQPHAERLRTLLEGSKDPRELRLYSALWSAEFRLRRDEEKSRVATDLKRLREIEGTQATVAAGAKLIGDDALAKRMTPPRPFDIFEETMAWQRSHPYPKPADAPEKKREYAQAELAISATWIAKAPDRIVGHSTRLRALESLEAPVEQIESAAEDVVRIARTDDRAAGSSYIANIAHLFVTRGILLERVPGLIAEALKKIDDPEAVIEIDLAPSHERTLESRMNLASWHVTCLATLSEYYEKLGQMDKARSVLAPVPAFLAQFPVPADVRDVNGGHNLLVYHASANNAYWKRMAEIDEHENNKEDALREYREALINQYGRGDELLSRARRLWKDLGRSDEAWQAWVDSIPNPAWNKQEPAEAAFTTVHRALPKVALRDLDGNEWPAERFAKTTVAIVWATWCPPCRKELPYLAKLAERLSGRADVQVISFDTDENPETAKQFVTNNGYKFPVLFAKNFAEDLMPYFAIPRTWIIRDGVIVEESLGFGDDGEQWVERLAAHVNRALDSRGRNADTLYSR